jgi:hypothetical protein
MAFKEISGNTINRNPVTKKRDASVENRQNLPSNIKILKEPIPICCSCKKLRDVEGYWHEGEVYVRGGTKADFTHGICPDCTKELYPMFCKNTS